MLEAHRLPRRGNEVKVLQFDDAIGLPPTGYHPGSIPGHPSFFNTKENQMKFQEAECPVLLFEVRKLRPVDLGV